MSENSESDFDLGTTYHQLCPTCEPGNPHGFVCPFPVPTAPGQQIPQLMPVPGHVNCEFCGILMPVRNIPEEKCASCLRYCCYTLDDDCPDSVLRKFQGT